MSLYFSNHQTLIKDCYPLKLLTLTPLADLRPDSNSLSKLTFYAAGRPKKLPKVASAILDRAERDSRTSGLRARADLAVTVDVMKALVEECTSELRCFVSQAMGVVKAALGRRLNGMYGSGDRDTEMEARAAGLFHAIAIFTTGPFVGLDEELAAQYLDCLGLITAMAQLGSQHPTSRWIALTALEGAIHSEVLYAVASDFNNQINLIVPALIFNCLKVSIPELEQMSNSVNLPSASSASTTTRLTLKLKAADLLASRKSPRITVPTTPPPPTALALLSVQALLEISHQSHAAQLTSTLTSMSTFFDRHSQGIIWEDVSFIHWLALSGLAATPAQYRAAIVQWWTEQVVAARGGKVEKKHLTLVETLRDILKGPTSLLGLGIGNVLNQLVKLVVLRSTLGPSTTSVKGEKEASGEEEDGFIPLVIQAISALGSHIYYLEQMNDLVSDLIDTIRLVKNGRGGVGGGVSTDNLLEELQRTKALRVLVVALRELLKEARGVGRALANGNGVEKDKVNLKPSLNRSTTAKPGIVVEEGGTVIGTEENGTVRPGLFEGEGTVKGGEIHLDRQAPDLAVNSLDEVGEGLPRRPSIQISRIGRQQSPAVSPEVFKESLFLLTEVDSLLRKEYEVTLLGFVRYELEAAMGRRGGGESSADDVPRFLAELHSTIFQLATSSTSTTRSPHHSPSASASTWAEHEPSQSSSSSSPNPSDQTSHLSSKSSRRNSSLLRNPAKLPCLATPTDYASLREIFTLVQSCSQSSVALLAGLPMLIALEKESASWAEGEEEKGPARSQACRELVAHGLVAMGKTWGIGLLKRTGNEMLAALGTSVLPDRFEPDGPETQFSNAVVFLPFHLDTPALFDALANFSPLQVASGLDRSGILSALNLRWTPDGARNRAAATNLYRSGSRSVTNSSVLRVSTTSEGTYSMRAPSLADLQMSLGRGSGSLASATPSIASTNGAFPVMAGPGTTGTYSTLNGGGLTVEARARRTTKSMTSAVLGRVAGLRSGSSSSRLSATPPYLVSKY